jgi:hypothetical protein
MGIYNLGYIFAHYGGGRRGKVFGQFEDRKLSYFTICRIIVPNTFCI